MITIFIFFNSAANDALAETKEWAAKVGKEVITIKDLNRFYYAQNKITMDVEKNEDVDRLAGDPAYSDSHPFLNKEYFLDILINGKLACNAAQEDKNIDRDELNTIIELSRYQVVMQYFFMQKLRNTIVVTDKEIDEFYTEHAESLKNYPDDEGKELCRKYIRDAKLKEAIQKYIDTLRTKTSIDKDGFREYLSRQKK